MAETLKDRIIRHIQMSGPLPLAEYMHWCMADRADGYYHSQTSIGSRGDFITAPEISQMFGELIGIWLVNSWKAIGAPQHFNLVELGPGHGTLMKDALRATKTSGGFFDAAQVTLIETSQKLKDSQQQKLAGTTDLNWLDDFQQVPDLPTLIIANEFLDVLPIRQYVKSSEKWHENTIGIADDGLCWLLGTATMPTDGLPEGHRQEPDGAVFEISNSREAVIDQIAEHLLRNTGAALFIDYGHVRSGFGDTFQAVKDHEYVNVLELPGSCDLTSHVDFGALSNVAAEAGCQVHPILTQGEFLLALGLLERAGQLGAGKSGDVQARLTKEAERLALPDQMGDLFKVFAISTCEQLFPFSNRT